jgi:hypothetical protein
MSSRLDGDAFMRKAEQGAGRGGNKGIGDCQHEKRLDRYFSGNPREM